MQIWTIKGWGGAGGKVFMLQLLIASQTSFLLMHGCIILVLTTLAIVFTIGSCAFWYDMTQNNTMTMKNMVHINLSTLI